MSGVYDVVLAAGASERIQVPGVRARVLVASQGSVRLRLSGGDSAVLLEGQGLRTEASKPFSFVTVTNLQTVAQTVLVFIGDDNFEDMRITGSVRIVDSSVDKTRSGNQYLQSVFVGAVAGQQSVVGIRHNGASGFVVIKKLTLQSAVAGYVQTYKGLGTGTVYVGPTGLPNKLVASAVSPSARMFGANTAAVLPTVGEMPAFAAWFAYSTQAAQAVPVALDSPIVLAPNDMFYVAGNALNRDIGAVFDIEETT